jgi:DNA topoisomerase VI subunit B
MADTDVYAEFRDAVNMTASELRRWLGTDESRGAGQKRSVGSESVGHGSGRKIVRILGKNKADLTEADERHMRKVVGYVHRHSAQRPDGDVSDTRWRRSLMNWGHDPLKQ